jgi:hypothetical protein
MILCGTLTTKTQRMKFIFTLILTITSIVLVQAQTLVTNATIVANSGTGQNWTTPTFPTQTATLNNGNPASAFMFATGFDFTGMPVGSSILGFEVTITRSSEITVSENTISLIKGGTVQPDNKAQSGTWPLVAASSNYGSSTDLWGGGAWSLADLNANFGVAISVTRSAGVGRAFVTSIQLTVHYAVLAPIILTSFDVSRTAENQVIINWATSTEDKVKMMYIERSTDGRNFTPIFNVTPVGARNKYTRYSVTDKTPAQGTNYYRLKEIDFDGKLYYFDMKAISISSKSAPRFQAFYNGADIKVNIAGLKGNFILTLHDAGGRLLNSQQVSINSGTNQASITTPGRSGIYLVNFRGEGVNETAKIFVGR